MLNWICGKSTEKMQAESHSLHFLATEKNLLTRLPEKSRKKCENDGFYYKNGNFAHC